MTVLLYVPPSREELGAFSKLISPPSLAPTALNIGALDMLLIVAFVNVAESALIVPVTVAPVLVVASLDEPL